ncbi:MAG TPA: hypothetical protein VFJ79_06905 [Acidimicrobiales bacterium]|nr:hypothetical protein [Acidimicrobiales bacterium]
MLDVHFVILGAVIGLGGMLFYVRDTIRGVTQPNRVTWFMWSLAPLIAFAAEIQAGVGLRSLMTFVIGFGPLLILAASFANRQAAWHIGPFDWLCGALSAAGLVTWLVTRHGTVAVVASIAADALAATPTLRKSWSAPGTESASAYVTAAVNALITVLTIDHFTTADAAFPVYILVIASVESVLVVARVGPRLSSRSRVAARSG